MAEEREQFLKSEVDAYENQLRVLAEKLQELAGVDCSFGACVFDPEMQDVEKKIEEVQKRKKKVSAIMESL